MKGLRLLLSIAVLSSLGFHGLIAISEPLPMAVEDEIEIISEFPVEVDSLEEFIQSYYELLDSETYLKEFKFLDQKANHLDNHKQLLAPLFGKLMALRNGSTERVSIYQIGDSHIKPGYFSTTVRGSLLNFFQPGVPIDAAAIQYHFTGINGASFSNLTPNDAIFEKIKALQPDLLIVSLGTNDAQGNYVASRFRAEMQGFMTRLLAAQPEPKLIFTLPGDSSKNNKHNSNVAKVCSEIKDYARDHNFAWWDLFEVMGGSKSITKWKAKDLASQDLIHYSPKGYMLQGYLFYSALIRAYKDLAEGGSQ
ncbi:MAG TPA: GDSL-type esterase/lipase family protein [Candidatus Cloacimonadota bacterium]|nr:GDSL-type esterase/lipase family protein [Candidatus Cloacimonadota bacterium]